MSSPWPPSTIALTLLDRNLEFRREKGAIARRIEHPGLSGHAMLGKAGHALDLRNHRVERIGHHDHERVGRVSP